MKIEKANKELKKLYGSRVRAGVKDGAIVVSGELDNWDDIVNACTICVDKKSGMHVVNDIRFTGGEIPKMREPEEEDKSLDGGEPDVLVIGGGISGASILRELSKWDIEAWLVDKESDLAMQASGRNDGEVHPGVDLGKGTLKQHYVLIGNKMYEKVCRELDVPFERFGQYVGFESKWLRPVLELFALQRRMIGVKDTRVISGEELKKREPNLNEDFGVAIYNPSAGCVCPYGLTIAYAENAVENGAKVFLNTVVRSMKTENGKITEVVTNRGTIRPKLVINAAGVFADDIAQMAGDRFYSIHPRRGTNSITDKKAGRLIHCIASVKTLKKNRTHSKGGGVMRTVHGNLLVGPDAVETYEKENYATNRESIDVVFDKQEKTMPKLSQRDIITYFTGVRSPTFEEDFIIEFGHKVKNLIHCAGIQSPGLTTAPAVALDVEKMAVGYLRQSGEFVARNADFNPIRHAVPTLNEMPDEERNEYIKKNPDYGVMICRCEEISKGEIIDALERPIKVPTLDGIKRRVRPGMGRCQGGFCSPLVSKIIAEHEGVDISRVRKASSRSVVTYGKTKEGAENA
ncbi:MAG: NAD(P)/FAD-dependent oxidoreductase [Oscillospiraceae bacterium]|nr:NAD(P)/FAD-dependent oxidoreductase [Oscillospiraceae bacterium]